MLRLKIYLQQSQRFQDFSHNDISAQGTSYALKCTRPFVQRYKAKYVLRQNSTMSINLFGFSTFCVFFYFWSLSLFPSQILVCATGFCSSISLLIWRFTFGELFLAKKNNNNKQWEDIQAQVYACLNINKNHSLIIHDKFEDLFTIVTQISRFLPQ